VKRPAYLLFFMIILPMLFQARADCAGDYGNGSAGDITITAAKNLSSYSNKNFRNLTIEAGGNLVVDTEATVFVSQTLTVRNGGRITSANGSNGYYQYDYSIEGYRTYSPTQGKNITINAANIVVSAGADLAAGTGGKGYPGYSGGSGTWGPGSGAQGGGIDLYFETLTVDNAAIVSGNGGPAGDNQIYRYSSGGGGSSGHVGLHGGTISLVNGARIETGTGGNGQHATSCWVQDGGSVSAGPAGSSGSISLEGTTLTVDAASSIKTGLPGTPGTGYPYSGGTSAGAYAGAAGSSGNINLSNFSAVDIFGLVRTGNGGSGTYGSLNYYSYGASGGNAGTISITGAGTALRVHSTGRIAGGTGGSGGTPASAGPGGAGGKGGDVVVSVSRLVLDPGSLVCAGAGGAGGNGKDVSSYVNCAGGAGGAGGSVTLAVSGAIDKGNEINIKTGPGGNGGDWGGYYTYNEYSGYTYYFCGGSGGKGGSAVVNLPAGIAALSNHLVETAGGGAGHNITYNYTNQYCTKYYYPGTGGATGDLTVNAAGDLALNGPRVFTFSRPGSGNVWTPNPAVKSNNGSSGSCTFNVAGQLNIAADNAVFFDDMAYGGYDAANSSSLTINCTNIVFNCNRPIKWSNVSGGTLGITTDLRQFPYTHEQLTGFTKDSAQTIASHIYKFTWTNTADLFCDIPQDGFQVSQDVSFTLDETIYNRFLKLFTSVRRYKSEDGGTNWQEITSGPMTRTWTWSAPATVKGNSRLKIGVTPYGFAAGVSEIWLNGVKLNTYWTPTAANPPAIVSYNYAILGTDVGVPTVTLTVNGNEEITENPVLNVCINAVDNVTKAENLKYYISHNNGLGLTSIPYSGISSYSYDLSGFCAGGNAPSGYYKLMVKVIDESFNTGIATRTIYYLKTEDKPAQPIEASAGNQGGFVVKDWSGANNLTAIDYEGQTAFVANKNSAELDFASAPYPYYQIRINENGYGPVTARTVKRKLRLPPGEGVHIIDVRYCNEDRIPGEEQQFALIVDSTPPALSIRADGGAAATGSTSIRLRVTVSDNISPLANLKFSFDRVNWDVVLSNGCVTKSRLVPGLNYITLYARDEGGNIGQATCSIWKL
jgi:hypothetical protein